MKLVSVSLIKSSNFILSVIKICSSQLSVEWQHLPDGLVHCFGFTLSGQGFVVIEYLAVDQRHHSPPFFADKKMLEVSISGYLSACSLSYRPTSECLLEGLLPQLVLQLTSSLIFRVNC